MAAKDRALQVAGLVIIIISLGTIGVILGAGNASSAKTVTLADMMPKSSASSQNDATLTSVANVYSNQSSPQASNPHIVQIIPGSGQPDTVSQPFSPGSLVIKQGDSVQWVNHDSVIHTVTSASFDSGPIWPQHSSNGPSTFANKFDYNGTYSYFCEIHPYMSGTIYVGVDEAQRQLVSTNHPGLITTEIELPQNAAYQSKNGPYFIPANAIILSGSRVSWVNHDFIAHTATSSGSEKAFDTGPILPSQSKTLIINGTGRTAYFCEIHPWMQASLTVISPVH